MQSQEQPRTNRVVGPHGSGSPNDNTARLLSFSTALGLTIVGSWYKRFNIHRWAWLSNDGHTQKEIDHIFCRCRDRGIFTSYRVFRGAEKPVNTDYRLVRANLKLRVIKRFPNARSTKSIDVQRLTEDPSLYSTGTPYPSKTDFTLFN